MALKTFLIKERFKLSEINANFAELDSIKANKADMLPQTATLATPTNVSSVTVNSAIKKNGICNFKLRATSTWTVGTSYALLTLPDGFRPTTAFYKNIQICDTTAILGSLTITTAGVVSIIPRTATSAKLITIDEMFFV